MKLWSARVGSDLAPEVEAFLAAEDAELLPYDCAATLVHARRLHEAELLDYEELREVEQTLAGLEWEPGDEDVHTLIERKLGVVGRKIHAGRSRNDQVVAAFRMYVVDACDEATLELSALMRVLLDRANEDAETPFPGYTHLQRAQPVTFGHHLLAWIEMLERDLARFAHARAQAEPSPLGAAALAGTTLPLPRPPGPVVRNSLDAVADRDFALDYLYAATMLFVHLSRIAEEIVLWTTAEFGFAKLPENAATGSSMLPQKLNPDVAELVRGKAGTAIGRLMGLLAVVKGLPLAYNSDLQEDKPPVFAARRDVGHALAAFSVLLEGLQLDRERIAAAASDPLLRAADATEALVLEGVAFRDAYDEIAAEVRAGAFEAPAAARRHSPGPEDVRAAVAAARDRLEP
jgi:argininosuccinate lyase